MKHAYAPLTILVLMIAGLMGTSCSPYHYDFYISEHRIDMLGVPSKSTAWIVNGRSKTGHRRYDVHTIGAVGHFGSYFESVTNPNPEQNYDNSASMIMAGLYYKPRFNFFEIGDYSSFSLDIPLHIIFPVQMNLIQTPATGLPSERNPKSPMDIGVFAPLTFNLNFGASSQEMIKGAGFGVGAGYWTGLMFATDFRGYGPLTHGPYTHMNIRLGPIEIGGFYMYSVRHLTHQYGAKLGVMF
jgi:hypothetical protein